MTRWHPAPTPVSPADVVALQARRGFPSVSVLLSTEPGSRMSPRDRARLHELVDQASTRLSWSEHVDDAGPLIAALDAMTDAAAQAPTDHAVALFARPDHTRALRLGVGVPDRVVIDQTFATRDLVLALQRTPRHVVLTLTWQQARLLESVNGLLQPVSGSTFPLRAIRDTASRSGSEEFLRRVDRRLGAYRALHPSPLVLAGPAPVLETFTAIARHTHRLAGTLAGDVLDAPPAELAVLTRPILQNYLASREQEALDLIALRARQHRLSAGMPAAWLASRTEQPEMLAVESGLFYPARVSADGHSLQLSSDVDEPDVIDDAVDELIEHVLIRGGWVALLSDGALTHHGGVALTTKG